MADISLFEFIAYGFVAYSSVLMLIISTIKKDIPTTSSLAVARFIYMIPGLIAAGILASSGVNIVLTSDTTTTTTKDLNSSEVWSQTATHTSQIVLQNPVWMAFHWLIFAVLLIYIFQQAFDLLTKKD